MIGGRKATIWGSKSLRRVRPYRNQSLPGPSIT